MGSSFGLGTLGKEAFAFVDFLADAKQTYWQILPIGPTGYGDSPYQSFSAFAGNPYFIDYRLLAADDLLTADEIPCGRPIRTHRLRRALQRAARCPEKSSGSSAGLPFPAYEAFCKEQAFWLEDYALFMAVKAAQGQAGLLTGRMHCAAASRKPLPKPKQRLPEALATTRRCSSSSTPSGMP